MSWKVAPKISEILSEAADGRGIGKEEALELMMIDLHTREAYALMETANRLSRSLFSGKGENHFHIGVNVEACPYDCSFCSLTVKAGIFREAVEFGQEQILQWAKEAEAQKADALNIMTTGTYSFDRLLELGNLLKKTVSTPLIANTRDFSHREGEKLMEAGFVGAYHAVRLGEGVVTPFKIEKRLRTIRVMGDLGLRWMNCVEPVGPEHTQQEIVELMILAREYRATYSGVMRRINFPGSPMERYGMISELEMAKMIAVSRLVMGDLPRAHCTHEPNVPALFAGANLFFPEVGSSPRDDRKDTGKGRGTGIDRCRRMQLELGWNPDLPSNCFG